MSCFNSGCSNGVTKASTFDSFAMMVSAIKTMQVRGAPLIGAVGDHGFGGWFFAVKVAAATLVGEGGGGGRYPGARDHGWAGYFADGWGGLSGAGAGGNRADGGEDRDGDRAVFCDGSG